KRKRKPAWPVWARTAGEAAALLTAALIGVIAVLGRVTDWCAGSGGAHLLPFAGAVLGLGIAIAGLLRGWMVARGWLARVHAVTPLIIAALIAAGALWFAQQPAFNQNVTSLRTLVGGTVEAERLTIAHQVYAAYRRSDLNQLVRILERARVYEPTVLEAAAAFGVDPEVLMGVGAAESSFYPRDSSDGGRG